MFLFVFALSEGARYGWFRPLQPFTLGGAAIWPDDRGVSITPLVMVLAAVVLFCFYRLERWKERHDRSPLFEFGQLRHRGFRYGLITTSVLAMGQLGMFFVLPDLPAGRQAPLGRDQRALDAAGGGVHHRGVPDSAGVSSATSGSPASCSSGWCSRSSGSWSSRSW